VAWAAGDDIDARSEREGLGCGKALPDTGDRADHGWFFFVDADIAASRRSIPHNAGKGPAEANPSPYRASDTVSGRVTRTPATASILTGRTDPARAG